MAKDTTTFILQDIDRLKEMDIHGEVILIVFCKQGVLDIEVNHEVCHMAAKDLLVCPIDFMLGHISHSPDYQCYVYGIQSHSLDTVFYHCLRTEHDWWQKLNFVRQHPLIHLDEKQLQVGIHFHELIQFYMVSDNSTHRERMLDLVKQMFVYEALSWINKFEEEHTNNNDHVRTCDAIVMRFMYLIESHCAYQREVRWYAERMHVTAKYLSTAVRRITGKTASQLIREGVIREIEEQLLHTEKDVKQIAYDMHFPSDTFFCKFVRENLGMSPLAYRKSHS